MTIQRIKSCTSQLVRGPVGMFWYLFYLWISIKSPPRALRFMTQQLVNIVLLFRT